MCGIVGIFGAVNRSLLKKMCNSIKHRGPDDEGYFFGKNIALGNRRLSIIDIKGGHQPIHNEDSSIWITYDGEVYNFQKLRKQLEARGHKFYTNSDTEVIVHAYEELGEACVKRFNGAFAFAVWDSNKKQLFLARDRFGIKPLYYCQDGRRFIFASEIKAILQDKKIKRAPNDRMIYEYLTYGYHDHTEETFFKGIKRLLPGHYMTVDRNGIKIKRYWDFKVNKEIDLSSENDESYAKRFYELLEDSVKLRLIAEVPIGTCLSGGIDSSSTVFIINKLLSAGISRDVIGKVQKTFSACYEDKEIDERKYINEVTKTTGIKKNYVFPSSEELWEDLKKLVYHQDEPFASTSIFAQWDVMKLASRKVTVVLDGQGGDEALAGYIPYYGVFLLNLWKRKKLFHLIREFFLSIDLTFPFIKEYLFMSKRESNIKKMLNPEFVSKFEGRTKSKWRSDDLAENLYLDMVRYSIPHLLRYEDRSSMAFSIESRVPFLDHRLVEYVFSLPITQKLKSGWTKYILRNAVKGVIPERIRKRRSKLGFPTPEIRWMKELKGEIRRVLYSEKFEKRGYFNHEEVLKRFDEFCEGKWSNYSRIFWRILNLEIWFEVFVDKGGRCL